MNISSIIWQIKLFNDIVWKMYLSPLIIEITFFSSITSGQEAASKRNSTFFLCVKEKYFSNMIYVLFYCKIMLHRPAFFFLKW